MTFITKYDNDNDMMTLTTISNEINTGLTRQGQDTITLRAHVHDLHPINVTLNSAGVANSIVVAKT